MVCLYQALDTLGFILAFCPHKSLLAHFTAKSGVGVCGAALWPQDDQALCPRPLHPPACCCGGSRWPLLDLWPLL